MDDPTKVDTEASSDNDASQGDAESTIVVWIIRVVAAAPLVVAALLYAFAPSFRDELNEGVSLLIAQDRAGLREWGEEMGPRAAVATTILMIVQALAAPIPAVFITWTNSLLYGWFWGGLLSIASATFAAWICFAIGRVLGEPIVRRLVSERAREKSYRFLETHGSTAVLVARLLPFVPFDPISYLAGVSRMRSWPFLWATFVGQIPAGFAYSYLVHVEDPKQLSWQLPLLLSGLVVFGLVSRYFLLGRKSRH